MPTAQLSSEQAYGAYLQANTPISDYLDPVKHHFAYTATPFLVHSLHRCTRLKAWHWRRPNEGHHPALPLGSSSACCAPLAVGANVGMRRQAQHGLRPQTQRAGRAEEQKVQPSERGAKPGQATREHAGGVNCTSLPMNMGVWHACSMGACHACGCTALFGNAAVKPVAPCAI